MPNIELTRAELRVWSLEKQGWSKFGNNIFGYLYGTDPTTKHPSAAPDPTTDISAAWAFARELMDAGFSLNFFKNHDDTFSLVGGAGQRLVVRPQESEAMCIVLAYYYWKHDFECDPIEVVD